MKKGLLLLFLTLAWISCSGTTVSQSEHVFILQNGSFLQIENVKYDEQIKPLPWPHQIRITDMYSIGHTLFLLINRRGVAAMTETSEGSFDFTYFYETDLFDKRTSTIFIPYKNSLVCHVYEDDFLRMEEYLRSHLDAETFIEFACQGPDLGRMKRITPPWQQLNQRWQAVVVNPLNDHTVAIEWKHRAKDRIQFVYSCFDFDNGSEKQQTREWFLDTYKFTPAFESGIDNRYTLLFKACINSLHFNAEDYLIHFVVTDSSSKRSERFFFQTPEYKHNPDSSYLSLPVVKQEDLLYALLPDEKVMLLEQESNLIQEIVLPVLTTPFKYTNIIVFKGFICASWEDISFTCVGAAGLTVIDRPHK
jgi:hypothetical protein